MSEIAKYEGKVTKEVIEEFLFSSGTKLTAQQKTMFMNLALQFGLNPFKREIYCIPFGNGFNYVTGYQVYIARAESTGKLDGWEVDVIRDQNGKVTGARAIIYRKDWSKPFIWEVSLNEFAKNTGNWKTMPEFMIKKVCIAQAFRLCFPNEFSGMPYIAEEIACEDVIEIHPKQEKSTVESMIEKLREAKSIEELRNLWNSILSTFKNLNEEELAILKSVKNEVKERLSGVMTSEKT